MSVGAARRFLVGRIVRVDAERRNAAGVDDAFDTGRECCAHQRPRAVDIGAEHRRRVAHPEAVVGGDMKEAAAAGDGLG